MDNFICTFDRAQYLTGQEIRISFSHALTEVAVHVFRLHEEIFPQIEWEEAGLVLRRLPFGSYGVSVIAGKECWEGAFDVVQSPRKVIRYAFLSDFSPADGDSKAVFWLRDLHMNTVQFYDWMYRHDDLIAPSEAYLDPLGRAMSLNSIRRLISRCRECGIRPFAYGAIYAATKDCFQKHPEWGVYTMDGQPMVFADWLHFMNVSEKCGWTEHLLAEYGKAIHLGFQGIHMDTYGFPKHVWDVQGKSVDLAQEFPKLIDCAADAVSQTEKEAGVIFNAVNDWPTEAVAPVAQDAVYIEVWPPHDSYYDLYLLIRKARVYADKSVVLAAYMKPFMGEDADRAEAALRLTWAVISASGGTQLVFGENRAVLRDSYYANYAPLRHSFLPTVQRYCDFLVRCAELLYDDKGSDISRTATGGINEDVCFFSEDCRFSVDAKADTVWTILRQSPRRLTVNLINLCGNDNQWNAPKERPRELRGIRISLRLDRKLKGIYAASPDGESLQAVPLASTYESTAQGRIYTAELPTLTYWTALWAEVED